MPDAVSHTGGLYSRRQCGRREVRESSAEGDGRGEGEKAENREERGLLPQNRRDLPTCRESRAESQGLGEQATESTHAWSAPLWPWVGLRDWPGPSGTMPEGYSGLVGMGL